MKAAILCYMLVISVMVVAASGVALNANFDFFGRLLLLSGAVSFFVSDLFVVREKFVKQSFFNPLVGLPLYYLGQFALAISLAYF